MAKRKRRSLHDVALEGRFLLMDGRTVHVDPEVAAEILSRGGRLSVQSEVYPQLRRDGRRAGLGRNIAVEVIFPLDRLVAGMPKPGYVWDHINRNRLDARRLNLREETLKGNANNRGPREHLK